ncbi:MAG: glutamate-5-semialdehyde dehydrogenase [Apilactobacillus sp.]|uniref:glutamate-5-semialdehyde dehydrogenase n=1 Tax=Apilactobacillus nanyangensis TaxID=2799579 RepID=UPI001F166646|nr:glutamate-5-semialdehyde dehydrogenase [Apilactobacillus nanyangensis]MCT6858820.1 glutamate-5-semialdehyde dehydrogenase [Apilactobacillus sp.]
MNKQELIQLGKNAKKASFQSAGLSTTTKNDILKQFAKAIVDKTDEIIAANQKDLQNPQIEAKFIDRLKLDEKRISDMANGLLQLVGLADPTAKIDGGWETEDGLRIVKQRVPLGVVGIIYEARPNVTIDAAGLCFKSGNAVILRGGKESINSNVVLADILRDVLRQNELDANMIQVIDDPSHELAQAFMELNDYVDVLIPRGSARLIQTVLNNATVPVIETGAGNCHIYVDKDADKQMARNIIINGKVQRPSVCNATEKVLIHKDVANDYLPDIISDLRKRGVEVRGDEATRAIVSDVIPATTEDWDTEYNALIISIKVVDSRQSAIDHINEHGTHHSEVIVSNDYAAGVSFQQQVDAACVYVNASSRFTDGFEFGFGAEIGISTQKLHARGPMGLEALTSYKYVINGDGQTRK